MTADSRTVVVLHGPSLSLLGTREPAVYGTTTLDVLDARLRAHAGTLGIGLHIRQSNHEGVLIDELIAARGSLGVVLNAAAFAHTSLAIADAVRAVAPLRVVEVHLTNTVARGRLDAPVGAACWARIEGLGPQGYLLALDALASGDPAKAR